MNILLEQFENTPPEIVFEWQDRETEARGWVVINSLRGGAAGGGTRMRKGLDMHEVKSLAKTMEIKFTVAGPPIGGAKSGIDFDPNDPRKEGVLRRWYTAVTPLLKYYYGTGGDLNVDEIHEVIPYTEECGIWHPQEGVFNGHFKPNEAQKIQRIGQLRRGVLKEIEDPQYSPDPARRYVIADMITGWGVSESTRHFYELRGETLRGKRVLIQGWGNVGSAAAYYMAQHGASVVGIIDVSGGFMRPEGLSFEEVRSLFLNKKGNKLNAPDMLSFEETKARFWDMQADVFAPCAASRLITEDQLNRMVAAGLTLIAPGANVPFADKEIFVGPIARKADESLSLITDFIANCGMARVFAYLMEGRAALTDQAIFEDTSQVIKKALAEVQSRNKGNTLLADTAFTIALEQLVPAAGVKV
jgi:glutamate dehydrogenase/leucine dehydrogenase